MASLIKSLINNKGSVSIDLHTDIILFSFSSRERVSPTPSQKAQGATEGNTYCKGSFVGEDQHGNLACEKIINIFFTNPREISDITGNSEKAGIGSDLVFLQGKVDMGDGNGPDIQLLSGTTGKVISMNKAYICRYNDMGEFTYTEDGESIIFKGKPCTPLTVGTENTGTFKKAPSLTETRPARKPLMQANRIMAKGAEQTVPDEFETIGA